MKRGLMISIVMGVVVLLVLGFFVFTNNAGNETEDKSSIQMMDCGMMQNPSCFTSRMIQCLPVTAQLTAVDGALIDIIILGIENNKCHFQRKANGIENLNCYFSMNDLDSGWDLIDQTFGNEKGLKRIIDASCA